jgi:hypothetical protein
MKLSTELQQIHDSGDCGRAVEGLAAKALNLEQDISNGVVFLDACKRERDQLAEQCIAFVKQLSELKGFEALKGFVDKHEDAEQADALHDIHKEEMR